MLALGLDCFYVVVKFVTGFFKEGQSESGIEPSRDRSTDSLPGNAKNLVQARSKLTWSVWYVIPRNGVVLLEDEVGGVPDFGPQEIGQTLVYTLDEYSVEILPVRQSVSVQHSQLRESSQGGISMGLLRRTSHRSS